MLMGFVSYASIVSKDELQATLSEIKEKSQAKTEFAKAQEKVSSPGCVGVVSLGTSLQLRLKYC